MNQHVALYKAEPIINCRPSQRMFAKLIRSNQAFLRDLIEALDALPEKRLILGYLENDQGVCALGAVLRARGIDISEAENYPDSAARKLGIAPSLADEIAYQNDHGGVEWETCATRHARMRAWVQSLIR